MSLGKILHDLWPKVDPAHYQCVLDQVAAIDKHGDVQKWQAAIDALPQVQAASIDTTVDAVRIGEAQQLSDVQRTQMQEHLMQLHPWRKGPYELFGLNVDCEWRSDWKWQRIVAQLSDLRGRRVLDVGCGSGYHCWRMLGAGAQTVIGIDPMILFTMQYRALCSFVETPLWQLVPCTLEQWPHKLNNFDTIFSMGVLYHRRSPIDHLTSLRSLLRQGGELVLETLVIEGDEQAVLIPERSYAKMRNVWFLPSCALLQRMLQRAGFTNIRIIDVSTTTCEEQRQTSWMHFESLADYLDPDDPRKTVEGYPAPRRATLLAAVG